MTDQRNQHQKVMKNEITVIAEQLHQMLDGAAVPSFRSQEFKRLMDSIHSITSSVNNGPHQKDALESVGCKVVSLLLNRLQAAMVTERAVSVMRIDDPEHP